MAKLRIGIEIFKYIKTVLLLATLTFLFTACTQVQELEQQPDSQTLKQEPSLNDELDSGPVQDDSELDNTPRPVNRLYNVNGELILEAEHIRFALYEDAIVVHTGGWPREGGRLDVFSLRYGEIVVENVVDVSTQSHRFPRATHDFAAPIHPPIRADEDGYNWQRFEVDGRWQLFDANDGYRLVLDTGMYARPEDGSSGRFHLWRFRNNIALVEQADDTFVLFDRQGNIIQTFQNVRRAGWHPLGYRITFHDQTTIFLDEYADQIFEYPEVLRFIENSIRLFSNGNAIVQVQIDGSEPTSHWDTDEHIYRFYNSSGQLIEEFSSASAEDPSAILVQRQNLMYAFIDINGNNLFGKEFAWARPFSEGLAVVSMEGQWEGHRYINMQGEFITEQTFRGGEDFSGGIAIVHCHDRGSALIDRYGNLLTDFMQYQITNFGTGHARLTRFGEGGWWHGLINHRGEIIVEPSVNYKGWLYIDDGYFFVITEFGARANISSRYINTSVIIDSYGNVLFEDEDAFVAYLGYGLFYLEYYDEVIMLPPQEVSGDPIPYIPNHRPNRIVDLDGNTVMLLGNDRVREAFDGHFIVYTPRGIVRRPEGIDGGM